MRHIATAARGDRTDDTEGLKVFHGKDWALIVPDPEDPITHIWTEGANADAAEEWLERYVAMIRESLD
jgi:mannose-1-phosphate guanylyltransferase/phosphomannomutase